MKSPFFIIFFIILIFIFIFLSSLFSFSEMALSNCNKIRLSQKRKKETNPKKYNRYKRVSFLLENYNESITTIVIFNNLINVLSTTITSFISSIILKDPLISFFFSFFIMSILLISFGEIMPKILARKFPEEGALKLSYILYVLFFFSKPINLIFKNLIRQNDQLFENEEEFLGAISEAEKIGITTKNEKDLMNKILSFNDIKAKEIMIKKENSKYIYKDISIQKLISLSKKSKVTRLPIIDNDTNRSIGVINIQNFLIDYLEDKKVKKQRHIFSIQNFDLNTNIKEIFEILKSKKQKICTISKNEEFIGLLTIEDILENIFGNFYDEKDFSSEGIYKLSEKNFLVDLKTNSFLVLKLFFDSNYLKKFESFKDKTIEEWLAHISNKKIASNTQIFHKNIIFWVMEDQNNPNKLILDIDII